MLRVPRVTARAEPTVKSPPRVFVTPVMFIVSFAKALLPVKPAVFRVLLPLPVTVTVDVPALNTPLPVIDIRVPVVPETVMMELFPVRVPVVPMEIDFELSAKLLAEVVRVPFIVREVTAGVAAPRVITTLELMTTSSAVPGVPFVPVQPVHILPVLVVFQVPVIVAVQTASSAICHCRDS